MNLTVRVGIAGDGGSRIVIVKQSRPWVEKYDFIEAPWDRAISELRFYQRIASIEPVARRMPKLLGADPQARVLVLEDLGSSRDLTSVYRGEAIAGATLVELASYLRALHDATRGSAEASLANREMRQLNHQHIYEIPLQENNGLDLVAIEPALVDVARELREDREYRRLVAATGEPYLADGACLLHGDYFPGSWLATDAGVRVIDPEFCFFGDAEFDLGVCAAHLSLARRPRAELATFLDAYGVMAMDDELLARFAACEVMRRLVGYAQLPLPPGAWRAQLLARTRTAMLGGSVEALWES